jgi:hypothetical protein
MAGQDDRAMRIPALLALLAIPACASPPSLTASLRALRDQPAAAALAPLGAPSAARPLEGHRLLEWHRREVGTESVSRIVPVTVRENGRSVTRHVSVQVPVPVERRCRIRVVVDAAGRVLLSDVDEEKGGCAAPARALAPVS